MKTLVLLFGFFGCSPVKSQSDTSWDQQRCESMVELSFPDGSWSDYDGCRGINVDAGYALAPDDPPEVLNYTLQFGGFADPNVECWVVLTAFGVCGPGYYGIGSEHSATVELSTLDCPYVPEPYEDNYMATSGTILLEDVSVGARNGNVTNEPLLTTFRGSFDAATPEGVEVVATWDLSVFIRAENGEEAACDRYQ